MMFAVNESLKDCFSNFTIVLFLIYKYACLLTIDLSSTNKSPFSLKLPSKQRTILIRRNNINIPLKFRAKKSLMPKSSKIASLFRSADGVLCNYKVT